MGDFDRGGNSNAPKDQTKQIIIMVVLAAVFFGYLGIRYLKPGSASGSTLGADAPVPLPEVDVQAVMSSKDPTGKLLLDTDGVDHRWDNVPPDPFALSKSMQASIIHEKPLPPTTTNIGEPPPPVHIEPGEDPHYAVDLNGIKLAAIITSGPNQYTAILNGSIVTTGSKIVKKDVKGDISILVLEVNAGGVVLRYANDPKGIPTPLPLVQTPH